MTNNSITTPIPGFTIREATEQDVPIILKFIKALAEYEKLSHEVVATENLLREHLFGAESHAEVVIGEREGEPVAFALFFHNFSTFLGRPGIHLEDLFVLPEYRGYGFGTIMLSYLANLAVERGCGRLEWAVLNWNKPAIDFYEALDARSMDEWIIYRATGETLERLKERF